MDAALEEEVAALTSIYSPDELVVIPHEGGVILTVHVPVPGRRGSVSATLRVSAAYPASAVEVEVDLCGVGARGASVSITASARELIAQRVGEPLLFELITLLRSAIEEAADSELAEASGATEPSVGGEGFASSALDGCEGGALPATATLLPPHVSLVRGASHTVKRSTFLAHVALGIRSAADASAALAQVVSDPRIARATHNMHAWRVQLPGGGLAADNDDDGEAGAGAKLAHLLHVLSASGVLVVVTRFYGGVQLGPQRFAIIANVARELLIATSASAGKTGSG